MISNLSYSPETPNLGQIWRFLEPCDLDIWRMTLKNNRAPLLSNTKLYASFYHHMWIQTGVTVRKRLSWVVTSVTLTFDLWPWPFAWTSLLSLVITPENFVMIRRWEHSQKGVTDRQTDRRTENTIHRAAWSQLKNIPTNFELLWSKHQSPVKYAERYPMKLHRHEGGSMALPICKKQGWWRITKLHVVFQIMDWYHVWYGIMHDKNTQLWLCLLIRNLNSLQNFEENILTLYSAPWLQMS